MGVNWGTMMSHPIHPSAVVEMLRANGVDRVKLFDADPWTVSALAGSGVQAMLAAPNDQLASLARDPRRARDWVRQNVTANINAGVDVRQKGDGRAAATLVRACGDRAGERRRGARCGSDIGATQKGADDKVKASTTREWRRRSRALLPCVDWIQR